MCSGANPRCLCGDSYDCSACNVRVPFEAKPLTCPACSRELCGDCYDALVYSDPCFAKVRPPQMRVGQRR